MASDWLSTWLHSLSLQEYTIVFANRGFTTSQSLLNINKNELKSLGITKVGHQNRLLRAVERIRVEAGLPSLTTPQPPCSQTLPPNSSLSEPTNPDPSQLSSVPPSTSSSSSSPFSNIPQTLTLPCPPPVPVHRSLKKTSTSASAISDTDSTTGSGGSPPVPAPRQPPPIKPRQQSLRGKSPSAGELSSSTEMASSATLPAHSCLSAHPQAAIHSKPVQPMQGIANATQNKSHSDQLNHVPPDVNHVIAMSQQHPTVSPRMPRKAHPDSSPAPHPPVPLPRKACGKIGPAHHPPGEENQTIPLMQTHNEIADQVESAVPPAIPVKRSPKSRQKKVVAPSEDVVFELENVPIPLAADSRKLENGVDSQTHPVSAAHAPPSLPEKTPQPLTRSPPPSPVKRTPPSPAKKPQPPLPAAPKPAPKPLGSGLKDMPPPSTAKSKELPPPPPQRRATTDLIVSAQPPPAPPRKATLPDIPPPLPEKESHAPPPTFAPLPPPPEKESRGPPPSVSLPPTAAAPTEEKPPHSQGQERNLQSSPLPPSISSSLPPPSSTSTSLPPLPPKEEEEVGKQSRPLPPVTLSSLSASSLPPLPVKEEEEAGIQIELSPSPPTTLPPPPSAYMPPPLPPKEAEIPPPPPPLSEKEDSDASDFYSDSEEEELGPLLSITSASIRKETPEDDDVLTLDTGRGESPLDLHSEGLSPSPLTDSSVESTPKHTVSQVRQLSRSSTHDIMMVSPQPPVIVETISEDYENQETIDKVVDEAEDGDYADQNIGQVHGVKPISSRTGTPDDKDYVNQETLEEDIIPVGIAVDPITTPVPIPDQLQIGGMEMQGRDTKDYVNLPDDQKPQSPPLVTHGNQATSGGSKGGGEWGRPSSVNENPNDPSKLGRPKTPRGVSPERTVMSPTSIDESALDFGGRSSPRMLTPEPDHRRVKQSLSVSSGGSSGATTPGSMSLDSDYYEAKEPDVIAPLPPPGHRYAASVYRSSSGSSELPPMRATSGTFAGHYPNKKEHYPPRKFTSVDDVDLYDTISPFTNRGSTDQLEHVPKFKEGFLHKKGGKKSDKPWQKRWVVFNGEELEYFKDRNYKISDALNHVKLGEMIDIKQINDPHVGSDKYRFDLVVINRVFQFYSDSREDCASWVSVLHAAISKFKPQEHEFKVGGSLHDPDKQGVLLKQGRGMGRGFKERYIALKGSKFAYYENKEAFTNAHPIHILELALANVRPDHSGKHRFTITMNNQKTYTFQAHNDLERSEWLDKITMAILTGLDTQEKAPAPPTRTTSSDILARIQANPANKICADCAATDPSWGVVNLGIMVCINCSGVHRSMGTHISRVRSLELDKSIWTDNLIQLMVEIGNDKSNNFWERHHMKERLPADVEREIREPFIRAKYEMRSWIPRSTGESKEMLSQLLCVAVTTDNLMRTIELLAHGANVCYVLPEEADPELKSALGIAKHHKQDLQVELLEHNGALVCYTRMEVPEMVSKKGHLYKTGSDRTGWKRRWCTLDQFRGFEYFRSETDLDLLGDIKVHEMLSISRCDEESSRDPKYCHCFEVNTQGRGYLFCADSVVEMESWIETLEKVIPKDGAEKLGFDKVGYLRKKDPHNVGGWKKRWFTLKGKSLIYYRREREELAEIDLRRVTELKPPDVSGGPEAQCTFQIFLPDRVYLLKADSPQEAESWMSALKHTQVSGIPLSEQQTTAGGIPILVHKCLQFVETFGLEVEGLYRKSGEKAKVRKLILAFNQDARGVVIDPEHYSVHDVTGAMKDFFKCLPDPLLTHHLYSSFIATMQSDHEQQLYQLQSLIDQLPVVNRETVKRIIGHLRKVIEHEAKNKMTQSNLVSLFGPTLMTVNADPISFANSQYEYACIGRMIEYYKWLFQVDEEEEAKEKEIESAKVKIMMAAESQKQQGQQLGMSSNMGFLVTIYIGNKEGDSYGTTITATTLVGEVVEEVATNKALPPDHYALYLVLGDSESHRVICSTDRLLGVLSSVGSENFLCLKPNTFGMTLKPYMDQDSWECTMIHVRDKKKWKKYPCAIRGNNFIQFKDMRCQTEVTRIPITDFEVFAGIERSRIDVKNPMPTRYCFWLQTMRGDDHSKFLCADSERDMLKLMASIVQAKYPDKLQTPLLPTRPPPPELAARRSTRVSPRPSPKTSPNTYRRDNAQFDTR